MHKLCLLWCCILIVTFSIIFRSTVWNPVWRRIHSWILQPRQCKSWGYKCQRPSQYFFLFYIFSKYCDKVLYASLVLLMFGCFHHPGILWDYKGRKFWTFSSSIWWYTWTWISGCFSWESHTSVVIFADNNYFNSVYWLVSYLSHTRMYQCFRLKTCPISDTTRVSV